MALRLLVDLYSEQNLVVDMGIDTELPDWALPASGDDVADSE